MGRSRALAALGRGRLLPFGVLPSSPKPGFGNPHFAKNLTIEALIFVPAYLLIGRRWRGRRALALVPFLMIGLAWCISLPR